MLNSKVLIFDFVDKSSGWAIQMKAIEQYFPDRGVYNNSVCS